MCWVTIRQAGDIPPATKAHSLTYIGNNLAIMFGGGKDEKYYDHLYLLDLSKSLKSVDCDVLRPMAVEDNHSDWKGAFSEKGSCSSV